MDTTLVNSFDTKYPQADFSKAIFSFSKEEQMRVISLESMVQLGEMAKLMLNNFIQSTCLPRVNLKNSPDVGILYDSAKGTFSVWSPRIWCSNCHSRRATKDLKGLMYCENCLPVPAKKK